MKERLRKITLDKHLAVLLLVALAVLPLFSSLYTTKVMGKFLTYMILALAMDLMWGYTGLMNLGFAVFFGMGGYVFGISMACQEGLPAFMAYGGLTGLPWFYAPLKSIPWAVVLAILIPSLVALFLGFFIFTSKIKGVFYNLITLAFAALFELFITTNQVYTGGASGVNGIAKGLKYLTFFGQKISIQGWYYIGFAALVLVYLLCLYINGSRFGKIIRSVRDNEPRLQFLGVNPAVFKMAAFCIAGAIAGFAGVLYIPMTSFISVESAGVHFSTTILIWLAVGGRGSLTGAMFGALFVSLMQSRLSSALGDMWQLVLGVLLIAIVMLLPKGIIGTLLDKQYERRVRKNLTALEEGATLEG